MFENRAENKEKIMSDTTLILAHGAGAPADSEFMERLAAALATEGVHSVRFEFPYMERRRADGRKRPPDRQPALLSQFRAVVRQILEERGGRVFVGGKSMGGRMASYLASEPDMSDSLNGCVCFGYPFHPPSRPERWRVDQFGRFCCPVLIVQGTRDPFGKQDEVSHCQALSGTNVRLHWLEGGNHDFVPLARQPETRDSLTRQAAQAAAAFMVGQSSFPVAAQGA